MTKNEKQEYELHIAVQMLIAHYGDEALSVAQARASGAGEAGAREAAIAWSKVIPLLKHASGGRAMQGH